MKKKHACPHSDYSDTLCASRDTLGTHSGYVIKKLYMDRSIIVLSYPCSFIVHITWVLDVFVWYQPNITLLLCMYVAVVTIRMIPLLVRE